jgi:hypothetical protein
MNNEKEIYFARRILDFIRYSGVADVRLLYPEEKDVVAKALRRYIDYLESETYNIGNR